MWLSHLKGARCLLTIARVVKAERAQNCTHELVQAALRILDEGRKTKNGAGHSFPFLRI